MPLSHRLATVVALHGVLSACGSREAAPVSKSAADILVSVRAGAVAAPDSVPAGWARVRVEEDGAGHILVVFRLPEAATDVALTAFLAALDTARTTPQPAVALGGPEVGNTGEVVIHLTAGRYVLGCVRRGAEGHRHASSGEARVLVVTAPLASGREVPPVATQEVGMVDFAYVGPERWPAGSHMLRVENRGQQEHQLRLARLRPGTSLQDWMNAEDPDEHATAVAGIARLGPGAVAYLPVELSAGAYLAYCLIQDPASGLPHVELGMVRAIRVE
jgi:uncharacterized cupredoxin-like copper-binding protein